MKTSLPFLLRFLLPPLYAALVLTTAVFVVEWPSSIGAYFGGVGLFAFWAYILAGLPALIFAILLGRFARRRPGFNGRLMRATLMGLASGVLMAAIFGMSGGWLALVFLPLGAVVGFFVEGTVVLLERRHVVAT